MTTTQQIKLLGTLSIEENGRPATVMKYRKGCALLAYLIVTQQTHNREAIADLLWNASSTTQSLRNLRKLLHQLRPLVPELHVTRQQLAYQPSPEVEIDFYKLKEAFAEYDAAALEAALPLYTGELLAGFYLEDAPRFNEWLLLERERWRQFVWDGYSQLCTALQEQQAWLKGIEMARHWLRLDSLDEKIQRQLIAFLAADGQIEAALEQYESCRQELWQELQVEPEPETEALVAGLKQLQWPEVGQVALPGALPTLAYVPYHRNATFVGRKQELQQLAHHLKPTNEAQRGLTKAAVVTGMGGLGKTQLAVEYVYRYGRYYSGGVYWISFADADSVIEEVAKVGGERGMRLYRNNQSLSLADQVARVQNVWQESTPRLLIFDNCEDENLAADWLPVSGGCHVLLTSRRAHWAPEMPIKEFPLSALQREESVNLLKRLAKTRSEADLAHVAAELGDHPLALQLAGHFLARHEYIATVDYLAQLQDEQTLQHASLQGEFARYSPTSHELHVARTFALSYEKLDTSSFKDLLALQLLARAACFSPGEPIPKMLLYQTMPIDTDGLMASLDMEEGLTRLLSLGLLEIKGHEILVMHRLLVLFTQHKIKDPYEAQQAVEGQFIQQLAVIPQTPYAFLQLPILTVHLHHVTDVALERADLPAAQLAMFFSRHLNENSRLTEAESYTQQAYTIRARLLGEENPETISCRILLGDIFSSLQKYDQAEAHMKGVLASHNQGPQLDPLKRAEALMGLGHVYHHTAKLDESQAHFEQALSLFENHADVPHIYKAQTLHQLGTLFLNRDQYQQALPYLEQALSEYETVVGRQHPATTATMQNLAILNYRMGDQQSAFHYFREVLELSEQLFGQEHHVTAAAYNGLGVYHFGMAQYEKAQRYWDDALRVRQKIFGEQNVHTAFSLSNIGLTSVRLGDYQNGHQYHQKAITTLEKLLGADHLWTCHIISWYGDSLIKMGEYDEAQKYLDHNKAVLEATQGVEHPQTSLTILLLGELHLRKGELDTAEIYLHQALELHKKLLDHNHLDLARTHNLLGDLYQVQQNNRLAREQFGKALTIYENQLPIEHPDIQSVQQKLKFTAR